MWLGWGRIFTRRAGGTEFTQVQGSPQVQNTHLVSGVVPGAETSKKAPVVKVFVSDEGRQTEASLLPDIIQDVKRHGILPICLLVHTSEGFLCWQWASSLLEELTAPYQRSSRLNSVSKKKKKKDLTLFHLCCKAFLCFPHGFRAPPPHSSPSAQATSYFYHYTAVIVAFLDYLFYTDYTFKKIRISSPDH